MPIYEYQCKVCKHTFESLAKYEDKIKCEACGKATQKIMSAPAHPVFIHRQGNFNQRRRASVAPKKRK